MLEKAGNPVRCAQKNVLVDLVLSEERTEVSAVSARGVKYCRNKMMTV
jgi:hypothetical protein